MDMFEALKDLIHCSLWVLQFAESVRLQHLAEADRKRESGRDSFLPTSGTDHGQPRLDRS